MIEPCFEYLSVLCLWLDLLVMSRTSVRVNPHFKELIAWIRRKISRLIDCNRTQTQNDLLRKRARNHWAKSGKWLSCVMSTYLYGAFDSMFLSCQERVSEWILNGKGRFAWIRLEIQILKDCNRNRTRKCLVCKQTLNDLAEAAKLVLICMVHLTVCSYHVTYVFQSEFTHCSCLNVKELLARNRCEIWSFSDCNGTRTHNHSVRKRTLSHFTKQAE